MISFIASNKMTDRPVVAACTLGAAFGPFQGTGLLGSGLFAGGPSVVGSAVSEKRPTQAPVVAAAAQAEAQAYALAAAANGAESRNELTKQHPNLSMWAFRGLEPWRDPA
ncbi:hypothetical protein AB0K09_26115 [Streptomyces sp. NPDC049577]|uniref:hypothetical protein n=1 Tax=Streptomyces sp. NPDC049577 TaxID=3155153 RepID=UPI00341632B9